MIGYRTDAPQRNAQPERRPHLAADISQPARAVGAFRPGFGQQQVVARISAMHIDQKFMQGAVEPVADR